MPFLSFSFPLLHILLFFFFLSSSSTHSFHDDRLSLLEFKNDITSDPHTSMADWSPAVPFCNWTAVTCSRRHVHRVISLDLTSMNLGGFISPHLGNLSFLRTLVLSGNALHGHIPRQPGRLFRLKVLRLDNNQMEGYIPSDLGNCTKLASLALSYNNLTGSIPEELGSNSLTEFGLGQIVSTQGDVYSYGIMLLEIITRKEPKSGMFVGDLNLHNWVNSAFPNRVNEVIDSGLFSELHGDGFEENNVYKCLVSLLRVGLFCAKHSPEERPTMKVVVAVLESIREDLVKNPISFRGLRRSISNLLSNSNAISNDAPTSNDESSSTI